MDLWVREARIFKYGSGTGSNFSHIRGEGEKLSGGGTSCGLMSFLKVFDRAAGAIKSGGTTRRAAKMVVLDLDHPDIEEFITWKVSEEQKVADLVIGSITCEKQLNADHGAPRTTRMSARTRASTWRSIRRSRPRSAKRCAPASRRPTSVRARLRAPRLQRAQRSRNTTRAGIPQGLRHRLGPELEQLGSRAERLLRRARRGRRRGIRSRAHTATAATAPRSSRPGRRPVGADRPGRLAMRRSRRAVRHTRSTSGTRARTTADQRDNPCSEYMFLDDTACNLAWLNLVKFLDEARRLRRAALRRGVPHLDVHARDQRADGAVPSEGHRAEVYDYRTLGLGYANLGTLLMRMGLPYDSEEGFGWCAAISALMTGAAYKMSAEMARELGPFPRFDANAEPMLRVMRNHRHAAYAATASEYEDLTILPTTHAPTLFTQETWALARTTWDDAVAIGEVAGYRNAQTTLHRAHRHHRPGHGLRHDRHRARLRAREVQEARRRRLLQDRQPVGRARAAPPRLQQRADRRDRDLRQGHQHAGRHAAHQPRDAERPRASTTRSSTGSRPACSARSRSASCSTSSCSAKSSAQRARHDRRAAHRLEPLDPARRAGLHARRRSRKPRT